MIELEGAGERARRYCRWSCRDAAYYRRKKKKQ